MKKCGKKIFSLIICIMMIIATVTVANAESYLVIDGFSFLSSANGGITIYGYNKSNTNVVIPEKIAGLTVEQIADYAFLNSTDMPSISFEKATGLKKIGYAAFSGCSGINKLVINDFIEEISSVCFQGCTSLKSLTIGSSLKEIPSYAFYNCSSLSYVYIPQNIEKIGYNAFGGCSSLKTVTIPKTVTSIDADAFKDCTDLLINGESGSVAETFAKENGYAFAEGKVFELGDVNCDRVINIKDATEIQKYLAQLVEFDEEKLALADYYTDGNINVLDVTKIQKFLAKLL